VGVDEVDAEALEPFQTLAGGLIGGQSGADLSVVQRYGTEKDASAIEEEVPALDPQLTEPEPRGPAGI